MAQKWWTLHNPVRRWKSKTIWRRSGSENIHLDPGQPWARRRRMKSSRRIRRVSTTRLIARWRWSKKWFLVNCRKLHLQSSRWTEIYVPREESFPIPLRYIDVTRATSATLDVMLECRMDDYCNVEGDREYWTKTSRRMYMVREAADKEANNIQARSPVAVIWKTCQMQLIEKKNKSGPSKNWSSTV